MSITSGRRDALMLLGLSTLTVGALAAEPRTMMLHRGGGQLELRFHDVPDGFDPATISAWVIEAADAVSAYYGRFPVDHVILDLNLFNGGGTSGGRAFGGGTARISLSVGAYSDASDLRRDWRLVHEMIHLALPELGQRYRWLSEGLATYLESVTRVRAGQLDPQFVWVGFRRGMATGLPGEGRGLDGASRRETVYWGGALYCLLADVRIRLGSDNQRGLEDAMRRVLDAGLDLRRIAPLRQVLEIADGGAGAPVLQDLYGQAGSGPWNPDLPGLWRFLGVDVDGLDDTAQGAGIRLAIAGA